MAVATSDGDSASLCNAALYIPSGLRAPSSPKEDVLAPSVLSIEAPGITETGRWGPTLHVSTLAVPCSWSSRRRAAVQMPWQRKTRSSRTTCPRCRQRCGLGGVNWVVWTGRGKLAAQGPPVSASDRGVDWVVCVCVCGGGKNVLKHSQMFCCLSLSIHGPAVV